MRVKKVTVGNNTALRLGDLIHRLYRLGVVINRFHKTPTEHIQYQVRGPTKGSARIEAGPGF